MTLLAFAFPGPMEMVIVGIIAVLLFGRKLPKLAFDMGSSLTQFKKGLTMPVEELTDYKDTILDETKDLRHTVMDEHRDVKGAVVKEHSDIKKAIKDA